MQTKGRSADKMQLKNGPQGRLAIEKRTGGVSEKKKNHKKHNNNTKKELRLEEVRRGEKIK